MRLISGSQASEHGRGRLCHKRDEHGPATARGCGSRQLARPWSAANNAASTGPWHPNLRRVLSQILAVLSVGLLAAGGCAPKMDRPLTVWAAGARQEVYPTSRGPDPNDAVYDAAKATVNLRAAINETTAFQVSIHTGLQPVANVDLKVGPLRNERSEALRGDVRLFRAWPVEVRTFHPWQRLYREDDCTPRRVFDVLVPAGNGIVAAAATAPANWMGPRGRSSPLVPSSATALPADLASGAMLLVWVDVRVGKGSEPGTYSGQLQVTSQNAVLWTLNLTLVVEPFALPDAPALPALVRFDAKQLCRMHLQLAQRPYAPVRLSPANPLAKEATGLIHATARMLGEHGITGIPLGYEPAMHIDADGKVKIEWEDYDQLVQPLVDGSAFADRVRPAAWPLPLDADHPPLPRGGAGSRAIYQKLLRQCVEQSVDHFRLRRWYNQCYADVDPQAGWPDEYARWQDLIDPTIRQADAGTRRLLRLPGEEMAAYGWYGWPSTRKLTDTASILSMPARFYVYDSAQAEAGRRQQWLRPDYPPFSPSLAVAAGSIDPAAAAWAAWRLRAGAGPSRPGRLA